MLLFYVRHGDPIYDPDSLTEQGLKQADALVNRMKRCNPSKIYASSSNRAMLTAKPTCDALGIEMTLVGIFEIPAEHDKETLHKETFKELYPFARAAVATVSGTTGILPIIIPNVDIEGQDIYRYNPEIFGNK